MEFLGYTIEELKSGLFAIDDEKGDSMYLIIGSEKALLIDTCMMTPDILPMIKTLTNKPIELALTHAHVDHMYHAEEFHTVYLHEKDITAWRKGTLKLIYYAGCLMFQAPIKRIKVNRFISITEDSVVNLGDIDIRVILASGHTPGSCIYVDDKHQALILGDAIGNGGPSAWMWMPGCLNISEYKASLDVLMQKLKPYETFRFLGGHRQNTLPRHEFPNGLPLNMQVVRDMSTLCSMMLDHAIDPMEKQKQATGTVLIYAYGTAGMWVAKNKIK